MNQNRGIAILLALLILSFLGILGGALLTTCTIDLWISDNYRSTTQSLYLAEAGIDHAREMLRGAANVSDVLNVCAGSDRQLFTADDRALIPSHQLTDASGEAAGFYEVWLRNDNADGVRSITDSNETLVLASTGLIGSARKTIEVTIQKGTFPQDAADPRLQNVGRLEDFARKITRNATDVSDGAPTGDVGGPANYRVVVANGDVDLGPGTGYGLLLVRGELHVVGDVTWNGLILVIGQGTTRSNAGVALVVNGGLFVARTRATDGSLLTAPANVQFNITDAGQIKAANRSFPYNPIAIRER